MPREPLEKTAAIKRSVSRSRKWKYPKELVPLIDSYFRETEVEKYTVTGLALHCGTSRQTMDRYLKIKGFSKIIKHAKTKVEHSYELSLRRSGKAGDIFALKNMGWSDQRQLDITSKNKELGYVALPDVVEDK